MNDHDLFLRASAFAQDVIASLDENCHDNATPCEEWDVRGAVNHLVGGQHFFLGAATGELGDPTAEAPDFVAMGSPSAQLAELAPKIVAAYTPDKLEQLVPGPGGQMLPLGFFLKIATMENTLHAWDAARGAGLEVQIPEELIEPLTGFVAQLNPDGSNDGFAAPVELPADASPQDRLLAASGRTP